MKFNLRICAAHHGISISVITISATWLHTCFLITYSSSLRSLSESIFACWSMTSCLYIAFSFTSLNPSIEISVSVNSKILHLLLINYLHNLYWDLCANTILQVILLYFSRTLTIYNDKQNQTFHAICRLYRHTAVLYSI